MSKLLNLDPHWLAQIRWVQPSDFFFGFDADFLTWLNRHTPNISSVNRFALNIPPDRHQILKGPKGQRTNCTQLNSLASQFWQLFRLERKQVTLSQNIKTWWYLQSWQPLGCVSRHWRLTWGFKKLLKLLGLLVNFLGRWNLSCFCRLLTSGQ